MFQTEVVEKIKNTHFVFSNLCSSGPSGARSKASVCGRSPVGIVGSNPTGAWMFVCYVCRVLSGRGLCD